MPRKKVIWLVKGLGVGGTENLLAMSVPYLNRQEFSYEIIYLLPWKNALAGYFKEQGILVTCLNHRNPLDLCIIPRLASFLKERKPDLLEIHLPYTGIFGRISARLAKIRPVLYVEHSLAAQRNLHRLHFLTFFINALTYPLNDYVVTVSEDTRRDVRRYCLGKKPIQVVYNGIDLKKIDAKNSDVMCIRQVLGIPEGYKVVGHVANLLPKKRQDILLKAARKVLDVFPRVTFVIVGRGVLDKKLKELAHHLGIQDNVIFTGFVDDLYKVMQTFDVFTMSSDYEGFGISLVEAMALGKPAVVTRIGGMPEVVEENVSGLLVKPRSPEDLADRLLSLLRDDNLRTTMGQAAHKRVEQKFDIRDRVTAMENIYRELINSSHHP
jgi:glycosyltransferase involved in cell wall biosynthesis